LLRGFEGDRVLIDSYFFPLYEAAEKLNVPMCVHAGNANPQFRKVVETEGLTRAKLPVVSAMHTLLNHEIPAKFPKLRWGFIEASASWVPWVVTDLARRLEREDRPIDKRTFLRANNMYVTCQTNEDLPYLIRWTGEDNMVIGTDYGHADTSSELEALRKLRDSGTLDSQVVTKILEDNPRALYGL
jgi:predicted TIM-barrel fold metal-dependent hydrolase